MRKEESTKVSVVYNESNAPIVTRGVLGCKGYFSNEIICFIANGDNNFINDGIVENSLVFVDREIPYKKGKVSVFQQPDSSYKLSKAKVRKAEYIGQVVMVINQYE